MKNKKVLVAILALVLVGLIGTTVAYYTTTATFNNDFTTGTYSTSIVEEFESPDNWTPGTTTTKKVNVKNNGSVEVAVRAKYTESWTASNGNSLDGVREYQRVAQFAIGSAWEKAIDGYYYYNDTLATGETSSDFISSVTFNPNFTLKDGEDIKCTTTTEEGKTTVECVNLTSGYAGAKYRLNITIETIQADQKWDYEKEILPTFEIENTLEADGVYSYEKGMTWGEWVYSSYNTVGITIADSGYITYHDDDYLCSRYIKASSLIPDNFLCSGTWN